MAPVFSKVITSVLQDKVADEPMVDEKLGDFSAIEIPVQETSLPVYWSMSPSDIPYVTAQTQDEHNSLLNTYYPYRKTMKNWKEKGRETEQKSPHYTDKDATSRKKLGAKSSVIQDVAFDKDDNLAWLKVNGSWHTYSATPEQFQRFLTSGSLGREMNNINNGKSTSMNKTASRIAPKFVSGSSQPFGRIASLFGF